MMVLATPALTAPWGLDALLTLTQSGRAVAEHATAAISPEQLLATLLASPDGGVRRWPGEFWVDAEAWAARRAGAARAPAVPEEPGRLDHGARAVLGSAAAEARAMGAE